MTRSLIALAAMLVLAACGNDAKEPKTADEVIAEAGELEKPRPGKYETKVELLEFSIPGVPKEQAERMKGMIGNVSAQASGYCLTEAEAGKGFAESIRKMTEGSGGMKCDFKTFDVDGNTIDAAMACTGPQGISADIALAGKTSAEGSDMRMKMSQKAPMMPGGVQMEMTMVSRRVGDCR